MPGTTATGYPYAVPDDALVNWPATSKALADKLEAVEKADLSALITNSTWTVKTATIYRSGHLRVLDLILTATPITIGGITDLFTLPAQDRPHQALDAYGIAFQSNGTKPTAIYFYVTAAGTVQWVTQLAAGDNMKQGRLHIVWFAA